MTTHAGDTPLLAWDSPVVIMDGEDPLRSKVEIISAPRVRAFLRSKLVRTAFGLCGATAVLLGVGGALCILSPVKSLLHNFGLVLVVGSGVRLAIDLSRLLELWMTAPAYRSARLEIYSDCLVWLPPTGDRQVWRLADVVQVKLHTQKVWKGGNPIMTVKLGRQRNVDIDVPPSISFDSLEDILSKLPIHVSRPVT